METATINYTINTLPKTKKEIVERLFKEGHINLDEVLELMKEPKVSVQTLPQQLPDWNPNIPPYNPLRTPWDTNPFGKFWYTTFGPLYTTSVGDTIKD